MSGLLGVNYRGTLVLAPHVKEWLDRTVPTGVVLNGHVRTGMALMFQRKADAMLFKLQWSH